MRHTTTLFDKRGRQTTIWSGTAPRPQEPSLRHILIWENTKYGNREARTWRLEE